MMKNKLRRYVQEHQAILVAVIMFFVMLIFNIMTPRVWDDYKYFHTTRNLQTIFSDEYHQYMTWTGRSVAHVILRFFSKSPDIVFDIFNSLFFVILIYQILSLASNSKEKLKETFLSKSILLFAFLWLFLPTYAETIFWMSGSANYLIVIIIMLSFLFQFHKELRFLSNQSSYLKVVGMLILGIIAGWCNENTSGGTLLIALGYMMIYFFELKLKPKLWMYSGIIGNMIGLLMMVKAPGNKIRGQLFDRTNMSFLGKIIDAVPKIAGALQEHAIPFLTLVVLLLVLSFYKEKNRVRMMISFIYFIGGIATIGALLLSPTSIGWSRSYFGGFIFMMISVFINLNLLKSQRNFSSNVGYFALIAWVFVQFALSFSSGAVDIAKNYLSYQKQHEQIQEQIQAGETDVIVPKLTYKAKTPYAISDDRDISEDPSYYRNVNTAAYYGVNSIQSK